MTELAPPPLDPVLPLERLSRTDKQRTEPPHIKPTLPYTRRIEGLIGPEQSATLEGIVYTCTLPL
jgi:hypothetical protein